MATDITFRGDEREAEFQVVDGALAPVPWASVAGLILVIYWERSHILMRFSKNPMPGFTPITNVTDPINGKFQIFIPSEITAPADPSRPLTWEAKVTIDNPNSPDTFQDFVSKGILTELDDAVVRNMPTA